MPLKLVSKAEDELEQVDQLAGPFARLAMLVLAEIAKDSDSDAARVAAAKEILDRAFGKPPQSIANTLQSIGPDDISWNE